MLGKPQPTIPHGKACFIELAFKTKAAGSTFVGINPESTALQIKGGDALYQVVVPENSELVIDIE